MKQCVCGSGSAPPPCVLASSGAETDEADDRREIALMVFDRQMRNWVDDIQPKAAAALREGRRGALAPFNAIRDANGELIGQ